MIKNMFFYTLVSAALLYLLATSPAKVDAVCDQATETAKSVGEIISPALTASAGAVESVRELDPRKSDAPATASDEREMGPKQRARRSEILENLPSTTVEADFPIVTINDSVQPGDTPAVQLSQIRELMDRIYLKNSFGR